LKSDLHFCIKETLTINTFKAKRTLTNVERFSSYHAVNTHPVRYENQSVNTAIEK